MDALTVVRESIQQKLTERGAHEKTIQTLRESIESQGGRAVTEQEETQLRAASAGKGAADKDIADLTKREVELLEEAAADDRAARMRADLGQVGEQRTGPARVTREERTYSQDKNRRGEASFFVDAFRIRESNDQLAAERMARHLNEARAEGELSTRATTTGSFSGLVVPQYLIDLAAAVLRAGRPTANIVQGLPLPDQGMSLIIPRGTTGAAVSSQATENTSVQSTDEVWANLTVPVVTIAGQQDISRQSLERGTPGIDQIIYMDLAGAYHAELDRQVLNGSGASNQMLGIIQTAGINAATAYGAAPTAALFNLKVAGGISAVAGAGSMVIPNIIIMNPRRWGWLNGLADSTGRPLVVPGVGGPMNVLAMNSNPGAYSGDGTPEERTIQTIGSLQGLPMVTDANVPTNVGTNVEDIVTVMDRRHALLWEDGDGNPKQLRFEQTLGNQLTVKLVIYGYAAFTAGRYPVAFSKIGGLDSTATFGQVAPTF